MAVAGFTARTRGQEIPDGDWGLLEPADLGGDLRGQLMERGYLYLQGLLDRDAVLSARRAVADKLAAEGAFLDGSDALEAIARPGLKMAFRPELACGEPAIEGVIYSERVMGLMGRICGEEATHYDYTWLRAVAPGLGTQPHCDAVYMGRGTLDVLTMWTPLGDVPLDQGGILVLEGSHRRAEWEDYRRADVDAVCENKPGMNQTEALGYLATGAITDEPMSLGGRWLTADYRAGDVVIFGMGLVHGSLDNQSDRVRLSTDSRYQAARLPLDERWVGEAPPGHGPGAKKGLIC